jgi:ArsR family transcriptional regulator
MEQEYSTSPPPRKFHVAHARGLDGEGPPALLLRNSLTMSRTGLHLYELQARIAKALGHPTRLLILDLVGGRELAFTRLQRGTGLAKANLSQHLAVLRASHVLTVRREGRATFFRLRYPEITFLCGAMRDVLARHLRAARRDADVALRQARRAPAARRPA